MVLNFYFDCLFSVGYLIILDSFYYLFLETYFPLGFSFYSLAFLIIETVGKIILLDFVGCLTSSYMVLRFLKLAMSVCDLRDANVSDF